MTASRNFIQGETTARSVRPTFEVAIFGTLVPVVRIAAAEKTRLGISTIPDRNGEQGKHQK
jgi:hypothetical protein